MSYPSWPSSLPQYVEQSGYQESLTDNTIRSKMDVGPAKVRRRFTAVVEPIQFSMWMTLIQWTTLRTFYYTTLACSLPFTWTHPSTQATVNFRFVTPPSVGAPQGGYVLASLDLEVIP